MQLWLKGTSLEQLRDEYAILHGYVKAVKVNLRKLGGALPDLRNRAKTAAKAHLDAQAARDLEDTFGQLVRRAAMMRFAEDMQRREMIWAHVDKAEKEQSKADIALQTAEEFHDKAVSELRKLDVRSIWPSCDR